MNNKDFFKKVLENEMPDLEAIRKKCLETEIKDQPVGLFSVLKNSLTAKRVISACACLVIIVLSVAAVYNSENTENYIMSEQSGHIDDGFDDKKIPKNSKKETTKKTEQKNNNQAEKDNKGTTLYDATDKETEDITEAQTHVEYITGLLSAPKKVISSLTFNNFNELKVNADLIVYQEEMVIISDMENPKVLTIPYEKLSMILEERKICTFTSDVTHSVSNGVLKSNAADGLTGCSFAVTYNNINYEIGYSTYKTTKNLSVDEEFISKKGYTFKVSALNHFSTNINGYYVYIKTSSTDTENVKAFINTLNFNFENLD